MSTQKVQYKFGLYEKALPGTMSLPEKLRTAKELGFDYFEISTDETDAFQQRMRMSRGERKDLREAIWEYQIPIWTMCLSGTRSCPIGSLDPALREKGIQLTIDSIHFAADIGLRVVQAMGYDEYYGERNERTHELFLENLAGLAKEAGSCGVMLALENCDTDTMDSLDKGLEIVRRVGSPWLQIYPDIANLYSHGKGNAWCRDQYRKAAEHIVASHVKDTVVGKVRDIPFGQGEVEFVPFFAMLREIGFSGPLTLEMWAHNYDKPVQAAAEALSFIKEQYYACCSD